MIGLSLFEYQKMSYEDSQTISKLYCGLCDGLRLNFGVATGLLISDEAQFLAILTAAQREERIQTSTTKCPLKGYLASNLILDDKLAFQYAAIITMMLLGEKLDDGIRDDNNISSKLGRTLLLPTINKAYQGISGFGFLQSKLEEARELQKETETMKGKPLDWYLYPSGIIVGEIFSTTASIAENARNSETLRRLGESVGKLINLIDMCEDFYQDQITNAFNPITFAYQPDGLPSIQIFLDVCYITIRELSNIRLELSNLQLNNFNGIIENVLTRGIANRLLWSLSQLWKNNHWVGKLPYPADWHSKFQHFECKVCGHPHTYHNIKNPLNQQIMLFPRNLWIFASYYPNIEQIATEFGYSDVKYYIFCSLFPMIMAENLENSNSWSWSLLSKKLKILQDQKLSTSRRN